jgi:hypothetical protein
MEADGNRRRYQPARQNLTARGSLLTVAISVRQTGRREVPIRRAPLRRRAALGPHAFVFGTVEGEFHDSFKTAWESLLLVAYGHATKRSQAGGRVDREKLRQIDLHWHDLRHEALCGSCPYGHEGRSV